VLHAGCVRGESVAVQRSAEERAMTKRQQQIAELAAKGLTSAQIAERIDISLATVNAHLAKAMGELQINSRTLIEDALCAIAKAEGRQ
jgi:DNA-binding NarL/FixJ family response regulator